MYLCVRVLQRHCDESVKKRRKTAKNNRRISESPNPIFVSVALGLAMNLVCERVNAPLGRPGSNQLNRLFRKRFVGDNDLDIN